MKKIIISFLIVLLSLQNAQAVGLGSMAKAASELIALKAQERASGVMIASLNSTAIAASIATQAPTSAYSTTLKVAEIATVGLVGAAAAFFGAPAWAAVGIAAGLEVAFHIGSAIFTKHSDGTITASSSSSVSSVSGIPLTTNVSLYAISSGQQYGYGTSAEDAFSAFLATVPSSANYSSGGCFQEYDGAPWKCRIFINGSFSQNIYSSYFPAPSGNTTICSGASFNNAGCYIEPPPPSITPAAAVAGLSPSDLASPADPKLVAGVINAIWAGSSGSGSIPYDPANPITESDVRAYAGAFPTAYPTNSDILASPLSSTGTVSLPISGAVGGSQTGVITGTGTSTSTATTTDTGTGTATSTTTTTTTTNTTSMLDWGTFVAPDLTAPSMESILDPLFNMFPEWKAFAFPQHQSVCPTPSFTLPSGVLNGRTVTFDQMCSFLDYSNTRTFMEAAFSVAWSILIIMIIMGA